MRMGLHLVYVSIASWITGPFVNDLIEIRQVHFSHGLGHQRVYYNWYVTSIKSITC